MAHSKVYEWSKKEDELLMKQAQIYPGNWKKLGTSVNPKKIPNNIKKRVNVINKKSSDVEWNEEIDQ